MPSFVKGPNQMDLKTNAYEVSVSLLCKLIYLWGGELVILFFTFSVQKLHKDLVTSYERKRKKKISLLRYLLMQHSFTSSWLGACDRWFNQQLSTKKAVEVHSLRNKFSGSHHTKNIRMYISITTLVGEIFCSAACRKSFR